ncbi:hypothetical protein A2716_01765 [candidate division WWE3 bacterium RIFCSPHIGHO2_01_FULL_40_23]|uniref:Homing endonuclease LAGLIDADG domain-containing protein n=1 Tax=candidate division WWE3 bacterium RIFCSPLOWO2_01_FULL_41_18 TaxID=1802625 RepID=A0A1F4VEY2_UNCKA|nr:MAG: hypothetical protein A2716_01765 [candidate division WWE3 bacterium RIFCSPHIGHO2_01_FULL_40_23]OGC55719.1 MAG: hypothetical protein A3A78_01615 [candidate division WWE3 bacterium RIFCSPLOWO2_01_FULL_41_18]
MGSQSKANLAYIAGFLDGDGSLILQLKKRSDTKAGLRFMCTICFYQDSRHFKPLLWIRNELKIGYLSHRNDGMSELRINGYKRVREILLALKPFIRFKRGQAEALFTASDLLGRKSYNRLSVSELHELVDCVLKIQFSNYVTKTKKTKNELLEALGLTP